VFCVVWRLWRRSCRLWLWQHVVFLLRRHVFQICLRCLRNLRILTSLQVLKQGRGVIPLLRCHVDSSHIQRISLIARAQLCGGFHRLHRRSNSTSLKSRHCEQVVGLGEIGIPVEDG